LLDTLVRWTDLRAHYSDFGVLSRSDLISLGWNQNWFSLYMACGSERWLNVLFFMQAVFAVALLVGWRTRAMTVLSWLFLVSIHSRNPMVLNGGYLSESDPLLDDVPTLGASLVLGCQEAQGRPLGLDAGDF